MSIFSKTAFFLVACIGVLATLAYGTVHQPVIALFYFLVTILTLVFGTTSIITGRLNVSTDTLLVPLGLFGIYAMIQVIPFGFVSNDISLIPRTISVEPFATQTAAMHIFALLAYFFLAASILNSASRLRRIVAVMTIFGFIYAFYAILQSVLSPDRIYGIYKPQTGTPFGSFVNKHDFAAIIEIAIALPMGMIFSGSLRSDKRLLYVVAILLMGAALLLSGSRGGLVALIAEILFLIIITSRAKGQKNLILKAALSLALLIGAVAGAVFVGGETTLTRIADTAGSEDVTSNRGHIWGVTMRVISHSLPLGAGIGAFPQAYTSFDTTSGFERVEQAHNDYLQLIADAGLPGAAIGIFFLVLFFRKGAANIHVKNTARRGVAAGAFAGCFAILVHSLFDFVLHVTAVSVMFLMLLAILIASGREYEDDDEDIADPKRPRKRASVLPIRESRKD